MTLRPIWMTPVVCVALAGCGVNAIPTAEEAVNAQYANLQSAYQRRADLIPNLQAVVKGAAASERGILVDVIEARSKATSVQLTPGDLSDPAKVQQFQAAQGQLGQSIGRLLVNVEKYPELKSQSTFATFQAQIEGTENRINVERIKYNEAVQAYNTRIRTFPDAIGAKVIYGAKPKVAFQAEAGAETAPTVDFGA